MVMTLSPSQILLHQLKKASNSAYFLAPSITIKRDDKIPVTREIIDEFIKYLFPNLPDLFSSSLQRTRELVEARQFAMYLHYYYDMSCPSLSSVGRHFDKDHATVLHAFRKTSNINSVDLTAHTYFTTNVMAFNKFLINKQNTDAEFNQSQIEKRVCPNHARKFFPQP